MVDGDLALVMPSVNIFSTVRHSFRILTPTKTISVAQNGTLLPKLSLSTTSVFPFDCSYVNRGRIEIRQRIYRFYNIFRTFVYKSITHRPPLRRYGFTVGCVCTCVQETLFSPGSILAFNITSLPPSKVPVPTPTVIRAPSSSYQDGQRSLILHEIYTS